MKRPFGQHFLFDPGILKKIIRCSNVVSGDTVVEIGPGLGTLTRLLSAHAERVIAVEFDKKLISRLRENLSENKNVEIIQADALKFPYETIEGDFKVVSNIPYNITTPILFRLLQYRDKIRSMTLLMQKEVARRITALPDSREYGVLSISAQLYTKPSLKFSVSRGAFSPPPDVDSAVVFFDVCSSPRITVSDEELFMEIVKAAFSQRRKTLSNSLKSVGGAVKAVKEAGIDPGRRPETLHIEDFARIVNALK